MRNFGTDKPEFMAFTLGESEKVYKLPLGTSLPMPLRLKMQEAIAEPDEARRELLAERFQVDFLTRYLGSEVVESLAMKEVQEIYQAWLEESSDNGASAGE